jgi:hypothetical protein
MKQQTIAAFSTPLAKLNKNRNTITHSEKKKSLQFHTYYIGCLRLRFHRTKLGDVHLVEFDKIRILHLYCSCDKTA